MDSPFDDGSPYEGLPKTVPQFRDREPKSGKKSGVSFSDPFGGAAGLSRTVDEQATASEFDLAALVRTHQAELWRYLRFLGCDNALAEDLTQETFLSLLRNPGVLESVSSLPSYLRTIARNLFFKRGGVATGVPLEEVRDADAVWSDVVKDKDAGPYLEALRTCVDGLDERSRRALALQYREKLPLDAAATALDLSREGVKTLLRRIRERLKACVEGKLPRE
jgi:RNA polymerase sigma-70 factor (ECF subfamily)